MSVRVLHVADVHLGAPLANFGEYAKARRAEQEAAFRKAVDVAIAERVHVVAIAGDLFDTFRPEPAAVDLARREIGRLREAGIHVVAVPGTHDSLAWPECVYRTEALPLHRLFDGPTFADPAAFEIEGAPLTIYGIAYDRRRSGRGWDSLSRSRPDGIHVAIVHAACRFNPDWPIGEDDLPFDEGDLAGLGMDYVALGHYHNARVFESDGRVVGAYSGSIEGRDWTELGPRHVLLVEWDGPGAPAVRKIEVQTRALDALDLDVSDLPDEEAVAAAIEAACPRDRLWQVTLVGEPEFVPRTRVIESTLAPAFGHLRVRDETTLFASHLVSERVEEETVRGEFFRRLSAARATAPDARARAVADRALKIGIRVLG